MNKKPLWGIRIIVGAAVAPFIGLVISSLLHLTITIHLAPQYPFDLSDHIWPHSGMRGDTQVPVWLMPSFVNIYAIVWFVGIPTVFLLKKFGFVSLWQFITVGALLGFFAKILMYVAYVLYVAGIDGFIDSFAFDRLGLGGTLHALLLVLVDDGAYGLAIGFSFWLIAVWRNPYYVDRHP